MDIRLIINELFYSGTPHRHQNRRLKTLWHQDKTNLRCHRNAKQKLSLKVEFPKLKALFPQWNPWKKCSRTLWSRISDSSSEWPRCWRNSDSRHRWKYSLRKKKWTLGASIPLPHACEACALPIELNALQAEIESAVVGKVITKIKWI